MLACSIEQCQTACNIGSFVGFSVSTAIGANATRTRGKRAANASTPQTAWTASHISKGNLPNVKCSNSHLHNPDVICSVNLGILCKFLSQGCYTSLQMFSLTRVFSLNVCIHTGGIQLKIQRTLLSMGKKWPSKQSKYGTKMSLLRPLFLYKHDFIELGRIPSPVVPPLSIVIAYMFSRAWRWLHVFAVWIPIGSFIRERCCDWPDLITLFLVPDSHQKSDRNKEKTSELLTDSSWTYFWYKDFTFSFSFFGSCMKPTQLCRSVLNLFTTASTSRT